MRALERLIGILEAVAENGGQASATVVAARADLSLSTTSRLMRVLADRRLLERQEESSAYTLGSRLLAIVRPSRDQGDLLASARPAMELLRAATGETVSLHVAADDRRVCIAEVQSLHPVRRVVPLGFSVPLHFGATGHVLLAGMTSSERERYLTRLDASPTEVRALRRRLDRVRKQGFMIAVESWEKGLSGISAPVGWPSVGAVALSVSGPSARWTRAAMRASTEKVLEAASKVASQSY